MNNTFIAFIHKLESIRFMQNYYLSVGIQYLIPAQLLIN